MNRKTLGTIGVLTIILILFAMFAIPGDKPLSLENTTFLSNDLENATFPGDDLGNAKFPTASVENIKIGEPLDGFYVIAEIPFQDSPANGVSRPTWKEVEDALPTLKEVGVNTILIWAPYEHKIRAGETITEYTDKDEAELELGYAVHIIDYLKPDTKRGTEEEFLYMIQTAHSLDIMVIAQIQVSLSTPGDYIYDKHPEWMLKNIYDKPALVWPWEGFAYGFWVDKTNPDFIDYVTDTIIPHWVKKWNVDGIYLDSPAMMYEDSYIKNLCDESGYSGKKELSTSVEGYYSPEPLVRAMRERMDSLGIEVGKQLIFVGEGTYTTWQDMPDDLIIQSCKGNPLAFQTDPRVDRSMGTYFDWVMSYTFRGVLKNVYEGGIVSDSESYVDFFEKEYLLDRKHTDVARFVNMWIDPVNYIDLLKPEYAENYITLLLTAPGKVVIVGVYQLPPQTDLFENLFGYDSEVLKEDYLKLVKIKKEHNALQTDNIEDALISPKIKRIIAYNRWNDGESLTVVVNANDEPVNSIIKTRFNDNQTTFYDLLSGEKLKGDPKGLNVYMPPHSSRILIQET